MEATIRELRSQLADCRVAIKLFARQSLHDETYNCHRDDKITPIVTMSARRPSPSQAWRTTTSSTLMQSTRMAPPSSTAGSRIAATISFQSTSLTETTDLPNENPDEPETARDQREDHIE